MASPAATSPRGPGTPSTFGTAMGSVLGSLTAGVVAGTVSCPLDTIKACMKGDIECQTYGGFVDTGRHLYKDGGLSRMFQGVEWRCANLFGTFFIVSALTSAFEHYHPAGSDMTMFEKFVEVLGANVV
mmetsp:Transcript_88157/g.254405  ORF Transcript_88157/g.254405 Transcript_88157/m.254405 type:complete len:128 (+) Transcript_88157:129-512(+)